MNNTSGRCQTFKELVREDLARVTTRWATDHSFTGRASLATTVVGEVLTFALKATAIVIAAGMLIWAALGLYSVAIFTAFKIIESVFALFGMAVSNVVVIRLLIAATLGVGLFFGGLYLGKRSARRERGR